MIQITAYLRSEEDLSLWKAINNKTEFIHNALSVADNYKALDNIQKRTVKEHIAKIPTLVTTDLTTKTFTHRPTGNDPVVITNLGTGEVETFESAVEQDEPEDIEENWMDDYVWDWQRKLIVEKDTGEMADFGVEMASQWKKAKGIT